MTWFNFGSTDWDSQDFSKGEDDRATWRVKHQNHSKRHIGALTRHTNKRERLRSHFRDSETTSNTFERLRTISHTFATLRPHAFTSYLLHGCSDAFSAPPTCSPTSSETFWRHAPRYISALGNNEVLSEISRYYNKGQSLRICFTLRILIRRSPFLSFLFVFDVDMFHIASCSASCFSIPFLVLSSKNI